MAALGGFLAVVYVSERGLRNMLDGAWVEYQDERFPSVQWSRASLVGQVEAKGVASIGKPVVSLQTAGDLAHVDVQIAARVDVAVAGAAVGTAVVVSDISADLMLVGAQDTLTDVLKVTLGPFVISAQQTHVGWLDPPPIPVPTDALINAQTLADLTALVRPGLERLLEARMPSWRVHVPDVMIPTTYGPLPATLPVPTVGGTRVFPGWLAIGVDDRRTYYTTHGDAGQIGMPDGAAADETVVLVVDAARSAAYSELNAKPSITVAAAVYPQLHPDPNSVRIEFANGAVLLHANGSVDRPDPFAGSDTFKATLRVNLTVHYFYPGEDDRDDRIGPYFYVTANPDIRIDTDWWEDLVLPVVSLFDWEIVQAQEDANRERFVYSGPIWAAVTPVETGVRRVTIAPDALRVFGYVRGKSLVAPIGAEPVAVLDPVGIRERHLALRLSRRDLLLLEYDPTYLVRYEIHAGSDGRVVATGRAWSGKAELTIDAYDMWRADTQLETSYDILVSAQRPPGNEVRQSTANVQVIDLFDRSHPYATWDRLHYFLGKSGPQSTVRSSVVHKTALDERCKFCDAGWEHKWRYSVQALDALPDPVEGNQNTKPCPYCFHD